MCGCKNKQLTVNTIQSESTPEPNQDCPYTIEQLTSIKNKLYCIKDNNLSIQVGSSETQINSYLGTIISAIYYPENFCYFQPSLDEINVFINNLNHPSCNEL